jgi:tetratricopeptide (TPR) repeat protein
VTLKPKLETSAMLLDEGAAESAVRMLRSSWEPELPPHELVPLYCLWIRALCQAGELDHALVLAARAADELPHEPDILTALGNVYDQLGQLEEAKKAFERALETDPLGALQHFNLGAVYEQLGNASQAEACYKRAIEEAEHDLATEASGALGALLRRSGRLEDAAAIHDAHLEEDLSHIETLVEHGICLSDLGNFDAAVERLRLALSFKSDHPTALYNLGITLHRMGLVDEALDNMQRAHAADSGNPLTQAVLGAWSLASADVDLDHALNLLYGALDRLETLANIEGTNDTYAGVVVEEVFEALWQNGRKNEAREVARIAGQRDWITSHILDTLNEADHGREVQVRPFDVTARAEAGEAPDHWPENAGGYTTRLTVLASNEDEARHFTLEYLRNIEPHPGVCFEVDVVGPSVMSEPAALADPSYHGVTTPRARGVVRVAGTRAYF